MANPPCPCTSGLRLHLCCGPSLAGEREPPDAEALMRSRFAAFATGHTAHLWRTLHPDHPDRSRAQDEVVAELARTARGLRYQKLTILDRELRKAGEPSRVLFHAKIFERGREVSFVEASTFRHDGTGWRYLAGELREATPGWERLTLRDFD